MNKTQNLRRFAMIYTAVALLLAIASMVLRCIAFLKFYDSDIGYFQANAILPVLCHVLMALAVLFFVIAAFFLFRKTSLTFGKSNPLAVRIAAVLPCLGFLLLAISDIKENGAIWEGLLGLGACLFFLLLATKQSTPLSHVLSGLCVIVRLVIALATSYFDVMVQMNAPAKIMLQLACLCGMLIIVNELRASTSSPRPAMSMLTFASALLILGAASLPSIIAVHTSLLTDDSRLRLYYLFLALFGYVAVRMICIALDPTPAEPPIEEEVASDEENEIDTESKTETESEATAPACDTEEEPSVPDTNEKEE